MTSPAALRWFRAKSIFQAALAHPEGVRPALIAEQSEGDADLADEVLSLLEAHEGAKHFFEPLDMMIGERVAPDEEPDVWVGRSLGGFELLARVGRGGMSCVYRARMEGAEGGWDVAIKLLHRRSQAPNRSKQLDLERSALKRLDHRYIARLFEDGIASDGTPFWVMELVEGLGIDEYANRNTLDVGERVRLVIDVCEAVAHVHEEQLVHRDIKPSNVLVRASGEPSLVDFDLARLVGPTGMAAPSGVSPEFRAFTPHYSSPEQVSGDPISKASDVYSLGALAYRLLAGTPPPHYWMGQRLSLSDVFRCGDESQAALAAERGTTPDELIRQLEGHLSHVVMRACALSPDDRHASVEELATELSAHLD